MSARGAGLLSPTRRRLWIPTDTAEQAKATMRGLLAAGWTAYDGPAEVDGRGWVIDGTDPALVPVPASVVYPNMRPGR